MANDIAQKMIKLSEPRLNGNISLEKVLTLRRSTRRFSDRQLTLSEISQLLWAAQGITGGMGFRTAPSAGALYPLEIYLAAGNIKGLPAGIYRYRPDENGLLEVATGDKRDELCAAALSQASVKNAPAIIIFSAVFKRTTEKYGNRGMQYVFIETGHAAQNICLQAISLGLASVVIGAFDDNAVKRIIKTEEEHPVYIVPIGNPLK